MTWSTAIVLAISLALGPRADASADRLYGRVLTSKGEVLEGYLRWDRNEVGWTDFLDGRKPIPREHVRERERLDEAFRERQQRARSLRVGDVLITWDEDDPEDAETVDSGVRFGHVRTLEVLDERSAAVTLRSGERVELKSGSTDLGRSFRGLVVEDAARGEVELRWKDLDRIDFLAAPENASPPAAERLYGTLLTHDGLELTGYVAWDLDEALTPDVLDGEQGGKEWKVPFGSIARIAPEGRRRAHVTLKSGEELLLRGTNDVNDENGGIEINDPSLGRATVRWGALASLSLSRAPGSLAPYSAFDGGRPLRGTVETRDGRRLTGPIRWTDDEDHTWETLDGSAGDARFAIELGRVNSIERAGSNAARVTLLDGRVLVLEGSDGQRGGNPWSDEESRGIFVQPDAGDMVFVRWGDFNRVTFEP